MEQSVAETTKTLSSSTGIVERADESLSSSWRNRMEKQIPQITDIDNPDSAKVYLDLVVSGDTLHDCMLDLIITRFCYADRSSKHVPLDIVDLIKCIVKSMTAHMRVDIGVLNQYRSGGRAITTGLHSVLGDLSYYAARSDTCPSEQEEYILSGEKGKQLWFQHRVYEYIGKRPDAVFFIAQKYCNVLKIYCCRTQYEMYYGNGSFMEEIVRLSFSDPTMTQQLAQSAKEYFAH
eukprot:CAMPEP_0197023724 /NCGR_PEP_ID=MMETSP1384-20130603/4374_1 /TAXON_ID=29189 /ORGANISM="Ammonia sp." /LENGTH=233 /DNA_ID=CAMNT_0042451983 /DNA_START=1214 /DNA_END=1915 /DNA_ORIENTATION=+